jgi:hypothetical protein
MDLRALFGAKLITFAPKFGGNETIGLHRMDMPETKRKEDRNPEASQSTCLQTGRKANLNPETCNLNPET